MSAATVRLCGACQTLLLLVPSILTAQMRASERAATSQTIDGTVITVDYSRPQVRGRDSLFGGVVHWGEVWTPGANFATTLEVNRPLTIDGHSVAPGKYSLWLVVQPGDWTMVIDPRPHLYHIPFPDSTADQIRYQVKPGTGPYTEMLLFTFRDVHGDEGTLVLQWGTTVVDFKLEVEPKHKLTIDAADAEAVPGQLRRPVEGGAGQRGPIEGRRWPMRTGCSSVAGSPHRFRMSSRSCWSRSRRTGSWSAPCRAASWST